MKSLIYSKIFEEKGWFIWGGGDGGIFKWI